MSNAHGCDISMWQDHNSTPQMFDPVKARSRGLSFVYIKASQGTYLDPDVMMNWHNCKNILYRGAYHYLDWRYSVVQQAQFFAGVLKDDPGELPPVVDYESRVSVPNKEQAANSLMIFMNEFERISGIKPAIYTGHGYWKEFGSNDPRFGERELWICDITPPLTVPQPWPTWSFWQYTFKGDGLYYGAESYDLDMDWYNGSLEQMIERYKLPDLGMPSEPESVPDPDHQLWRVSTDVLNVRAAPNLEASVTWQLTRGDVVEAIEYQNDSSYLWAKHAKGWSAVGRSSYLMEPTK